jgi:electron-transferring-flavoprotein dehydrogenase
MRAHGFPIVSISELSAWLAERCEAAGAEIYTELTAAEWLMQDGRIIGVRVGDKGIDKHGNRKANYEAGPDIHARVVLLGEGACGALTEQLVTEKHLNRTANKQTYALGIKELIRLPADPQRAGRIFHTFGYPMDYRTYGGGFFYGMDESHVALGLVTALDYRHPDLNPHDCFRAFKAHPLVRKHIQDGTVEEYGAKVIPEGGYFSIPELVTDGAMILGDSAGLQDSVWLKGIHLAIESGVAAGNTLFECMQQEDWSLSQLQHYPEQLKTMNGWRRMKKYRNVRGAFQYGLLPGIAATGISWLTGGWLPPGRIRQHEDHQTLRPRSGRAACTKQAPPLDTDRQLQLDILSDVYYSGTEHEEDQPGHLVIPDPEHCIRQCMDPFGAPCTRFCPAQVYEMADDGRQIIIQPSNCLHCRTCQIKCPFQNIIWRLPEGGGGPRYKRM